MSTSIDATHDPALQSWVSSANDPMTDFPIQNLPFGRFRESPQSPWRVGVAIGDQVLDLHAAGLIEVDDMSRLMSAEVAARRALRHAISAALAAGSREQDRLQSMLRAQASVELGMPCVVGDYTDFYVGIHHATAVGKLFRPDDPLLPNYRWVPIGYHGRASTLRASGHTFLRPLGQAKAADTQVPVLRPTARLDYELEMAIVVAQPNEMGSPIPIDLAEQHIFGLALFNDWSARDIQAWEYQPLGPFLSKNFASTMSPWIVTMEALAPFRRAFVRPAGEPQPLPYLDGAGNRESGALDIELEVLLQTSEMRSGGRPPERLTRSNFGNAAYWTAAQLIAHHTINGCSLNPGDLLGTGTLSGQQQDQAGSLLEQSQGGRQPITLSNGQKRIFIEDGDTVILRGWCERSGFRRIGFGPCAATVAPALDAASLARQAWQQA